MEKYSVTVYKSMSDQSHDKKYSTKIMTLHDCNAMIGGLVMSGEFELENAAPNYCSLFEKHAPDAVYKQIMFKIEKVL